jgi:hypothetical protein
MYSYIPNIPDPPQYSAPGYRNHRQSSKPAMASDDAMNAPLPPDRWESQLMYARASARTLALLVRANSANPVSLQPVWVTEADEEETEIFAQSEETEDLSPNFVVEGEDDWF